MKYVIPFLLVVIILCISSCSDERISPTQTESNITAQDVPPEVQKILDRYAIPDEIPIPFSKVNNDSHTPPLDGYDVYAVTILWGQLFSFSPPPSITTDWSGTLSTNAAAIINVRETIDFELGQDSILPAITPTYTEWVSFTTGDLDGLSFLVYTKRDVVYVVPPVLTFSTSPFTMSWDFETLADFSAFYLINNTDAVAIISKKIWPHDCPSGIISGEWIKAASFADSGIFQGLWLDRNSEPEGYLSGTYWMNSDGGGEFAGVVSGYLTDEVIVEVHGQWQYDDPRLCPLCGEGHGIFHGRYVYLHDGKSGSMWGEFGDLTLPLEEVVMPMKGWWRDDCPTITPTVITDHYK